MFSMAVQLSPARANLVFVTWLVSNNFFFEREAYPRVRFVYQLFFVQDTQRQSSICAEVWREGYICMINVRGVLGEETSDSFALTRVVIIEHREPLHACAANIANTYSQRCLRSTYPGLAVDRHDYAGVTGL